MIPYTRWDFTLVRHRRLKLTSSITLFVFANNEESAHMLMHLWESQFPGFLLDECKDTGIPYKKGGGWSYYHEFAFRDENGHGMVEIQPCQPKETDRLITVAKIRLRRGEKWRYTGCTQL